MAVKEATFEVGVDGATIATADAGSPDAWQAVTIAGGHTLTYANNFPAAGTAMGAEFAFSNSGVTKLNWTGLGTLADHYGRFYLRTASAAGNRFLVSFNSNTDAPLAGLWLISGKLAIYTKFGDTQVCITASAIPTDALMRIEYHVGHHDTTGFGRLLTFNTPDSETPTEDVGADTGAFDTLEASGAMTQVHYGQSFSSSATALTFYVDEIVVGATDWVGPVESDAAAPVLFYVKA